jgi:hypothetical protein
MRFPEAMRFPDGLRAAELQGFRTSGLQGFTDVQRELYRSIPVYYNVILI